MHEHSHVKNSQGNINIPNASVEQAKAEGGIGIPLKLAVMPVTPMGSERDFNSLMPIQPPNLCISPWESPYSVTLVGTDSIAEQSLSGQRLTNTASSPFQTLPDTPPGTPPTAHPATTHLAAPPHSLPLSPPSSITSTPTRSVKAYRHKADQQDHLAKKLAQGSELLKEGTPVEPVVESKITYQLSAYREEQQNDTDSDDSGAADNNIDGIDLDDSDKIDITGSKSLDKPIWYYLGGGPFGSNHNRKLCYKGLGRDSPSPWSAKNRKYRMHPGDWTTKKAHLLRQVPNQAPFPCQRCFVKDLHCDCVLPVCGRCKRARAPPNSILQYHTRGIHIHTTEGIYKDLLACYETPSVEPEEPQEARDKKNWILPDWTNYHQPKNAMEFEKNVNKHRYWDDYFDFRKYHLLDKAEREFLRRFEKSVRFMEGEGEVVERGI